jgi:hypothetical protein
MGLKCPLNIGQNGNLLADIEDADVYINDVGAISPTGGLTCGVAAHSVMHALQAWLPYYPYSSVNGP